MSWHKSGLKTGEVCNKGGVWWGVYHGIGRADKNLFIKQDKSAIRVVFGEVFTMEQELRSGQSFTRSGHQGDLRRSWEKHGLKRGVVCYEGGLWQPIQHATGIMIRSGPVICQVICGTCSRNSRLNISVALNRVGLLWGRSVVKASLDHYASHTYSSWWFVMRGVCCQGIPWPLCQPHLQQLVVRYEGGL